jgi:hypothetical protein
MCCFVAQDYPRILVAFTRIKSVSSGHCYGELMPRQGRNRRPYNFTERKEGLVVYRTLPKHRYVLSSGKPILHLDLKEGLQILQANGMKNTWGETKVEAPYLPNDLGAFFSLNWSDPFLSAFMATIGFSDPLLVDNYLIRKTARKPVKSMMTLGRIR